MPRRDRVSQRRRGTCDRTAAGAHCVATVRAQGGVGDLASTCRIAARLRRSHAVPKTKADSDGFHHEVVDLDRNALLQEVHGDQQAIRSSPLNDRPFISGHRAVPNPNRPSWTQTLFDGERSTRRNQIGKPPQIAMLLLLPRHRQDSRDPVGPECSNTFVGRPQQKHIPWEHWIIGTNSTTPNEMVAGNLGQAKGNPVSPAG